MSPYELGPGSNVPGRDGTRLSDGGIADIRQRDSGCLAVPTTGLWLGLIKPEHTTAARARGEAVSKLKEGGEYAYQRLNLVTMRKAQKRKVKTSNRTREIRPSGIIGGPRET